MSSTASSLPLEPPIMRVENCVRRHHHQSQKLVRTSSLEKIRRFNTFICSQQYYVLPALLSWLKTSQSSLQSSTEKTIFFFRSIIFNTLFYKLYRVEYRKRIESVTRNNLLLKISVAFIAFALFTQLVGCFYLLSNTNLPMGLIFLILCCFYIVHLNYQSVFYSINVKRIQFRKHE